MATDPTPAVPPVTAPAAPVVAAVAPVVTAPVVPPVAGASAAAPTTEDTAVPRPAPPPSIFILGPSFDNHVEPVATTVPTATATPGKRTIGFHPTKPTEPGGKVNLQIQPPLNPGDALPLNVYAFFHQPVASVPPLAQRTTDFFFKGGAPSGSIHSGAADADGNLSITVAGVQPSLQPYFVQTILEFSGSN